MGATAAKQLEDAQRDSPMQPPPEIADAKVTIYTVKPNGDVQKEETTLGQLCETLTEAQSRKIIGQALGTIPPDPAWKFDILRNKGLIGQSVGRTGGWRGGR